MLAALSLPQIGSAQPGIQALGSLPGGAPGSTAYGISSNGQVVIGQSDSSAGLDGFHWDAVDGMVGIGDLPGSLFASEARAASFDGAFITGNSQSQPAPNNQEAFRWTALGGVVGLGIPGGWLTSNARDISGDGSVIVGYWQGSMGRAAFRWNEVDGMVTLGDIPGGSTTNEATGVSADGTIIAGTARNMDNVHMAFRWTGATGMEPLNEDYTVFGNNWANAISEDGFVIVGVGASVEMGIAEAFRWDTINGMQPLDTHDWATRLFGESTALAASADGSVIVGWGVTETSNKAFYWSETGGLQILEEMLSGHGIDLTGWELTEAVGVSADGLTIAGNGIYEGVGMAWIATIPEPSTYALAGFGILTTGLLFCHRRSRPLV